MLLYEREERGREETSDTSTVFPLFLVLDKISLVCKHEGLNFGQNNIRGPLVNLRDEKYVIHCAKYWLTDYFFGISHATL